MIIKNFHSHQKAQAHPRLIKITSVLFAATALIACAEESYEVTVEDALLEASSLEIESAEIPELILIEHEVNDESTDFCAIDNLQRRGRESAEGRRGRGHSERDDHVGRGHRGSHPERDMHSNRPERVDHRDHHENGQNPIFAAYDLDGDQNLSDEERSALESDLVAGCEARRARIIESYDTDGDGVLSEEERSVAQETIAAERAAERASRNAELIERFDANGDGVLSHEERHTARDTLHAEREAALIESYDTDGDGELSEEELRVLTQERSAEIQARIQNGEPPHDHPPH